LIIERNESLLTITELDALGGYLEAVRIRDNDSLHAVHLFASSSASLHVLEVAFNPALERLWGFDGSPHGTRVSGSITVEHNDALERASLPVLSFGDATESIRVQHNAALLLLELVTGKQTWLPGDLLLEDNPSLQRLAGFSSIRQVGGHLHLRGNTSLTTLGAFETLLRIDGDLLVEQSHGLTDVNLGALRVIYGNLVVRSNHGLTSLQGLTSLAALRGDLAIERNPDLDLCDVEVLQRQVQRAAPKTLCGR
jgi:hypothetical protein